MWNEKQEMLLALLIIVGTSLTIGEFILVCVIALKIEAIAQVMGGM